MLRLLFAALAALVLLSVGVGAQTTPATECGVWQGDTQAYLCTAVVPCFDALQHPLPCGLLTAPVLGAVSKCNCTSCQFNDATQGCSGKCQYAHQCVVNSAVPRTCTCTPVPPTPAPPTPLPSPPAPPTPAPPAPCGKYVQNTAADGTPTTLCDPPTCADAPGQLCGLLVAPGPAPSTPTCACSNCTYAPATERCVGVCPLGYGCSLVAGTTKCLCARQATPAPTPPPPCGIFQDDTKTWLCTPSDCPSVQVPGTNVLQPSRCAVLERTAAGAPAACACTTCHLDLATKRCAGRCQIGHVCTRGTGAAAETCTCRRRVTIIIWIAIALTLLVPLALVLAAMFIG